METLDAGAAVAVVNEAAPSPKVVELPAPGSPAWTPEELRANASWAALTTVFLLALFVVLRFLPSVGWPLVLAGIGAYLFDPLVTAATRRGLSRTAATGLLFGAGLVLSGLATLILAPLVVAQAAKLPAYLTATFGNVLPRLEDMIGAPLPSDVRDLADLARTHVEQIVTQVLPNTATVVGTIVGGSLSLLSFVLGALVIPVVGFYLLRGWPNLVAGFERLIPPRQLPVVRRRMSEIDLKLGGFIRGQLTMAAVLATLYSGALSLIGLKLAVVVGLVTGIGNLVPYVGTATGITLATAFCLVDFGPDYHLALVVGTFALLVAADGVFITPRIVGNRVGLSPAAVIVAVLACGSLFGFAGVLLAVPSAAILKVVAKVAVEAWRQTRVYLES